MFLLLFNTYLHLLTGAKMQQLVAQDGYSRGRTRSQTRDQVAIEQDQETETQD